MTTKLRTRSTVAPQVLRTSSAGPHVGPVSGREGKGREEEWKNLTIHSQLTTGAASDGEWMAVAWGDLR